MISQLVILASREDQLGSTAVSIFAGFLERLLRRVPEMTLNPVPDVDLTPVEAFINQNEVSLTSAALKFMDVPSNRQILVFSFAQNFRFLANMQKADRSTWIPLSD
jgi:hypothetical protein